MKKTENMMKLMSRRRKRDEKDVDGIGQDEKKTNAKEDERILNGVEKEEDEV